MSLNESIVEDAALECFGELAYAIGHGPQLALGKPAAVHNPGRGAVYFLPGAAIPKPEEVFGAGSEQYDGRSAHLEPSSAHFPESVSSNAEHVALSSLAELLNRDTDALRQQQLKPLAKEGKLRLAFPTAPTHAKQAYRAAE